MFQRLLNLSLGNETILNDIFNTNLIDAIACGRNFSFLGIIRAIRESQLND